MTNGFFDIHRDSKKAAKRIASAQALRVIRLAVLKKISNHPFGSKYHRPIERFLDTELGMSLFSMAIGTTFSFVPPFKHEQKASFLKSELSNGSIRFYNLVRKSKFSKLFF